MPDPKWKAMDAFSVDLPVPAFVGADAADEASGFQVGEMRCRAFLSHYKSSIVIVLSRSFVSFGTVESLFA